MSEKSVVTTDSPFSPLHSDYEDIADKIGESDEHLERKRQEAIRLWMNGWTVYTEYTINSGRVVDVYAVKDDKAKIVEVGNIKSDKEQELKARNEEYINVPYETESGKVHGQHTVNSSTVVKSVSFSDELYIRLLEEQPDGMNFSNWVEKLAIEGLNKRQNEQADKQTSMETN